MTNLKKIFLVAVVAAAAALLIFFKDDGRNSEYLRESSKIQLSDKYSFKFRFAEKPKIGLVVVKILVLDQDGKKNNDLKISAAYGMEKMKNHYFPNQDFVLNKEGEYLLPVNVVMKGDWEIEISIKDQAHEIFRGKILLKV